MSAQSHYETLGVHRTATAAEIKAAYRRLAKAWHPDRNRRADAAARFREINDAYQCLINETARRDYDALLRRAEAAWQDATGGDPWRDITPTWLSELESVFAHWDARLRLNPEKLVTFFTRVDTWLRRAYETKPRRA